MQDAFIEEFFPEGVEDFVVCGGGHGGRKREVGDEIAKRGWRGESYMTQITLTGQGLLCRGAGIIFGGQNQTPKRPNPNWVNNVYVLDIHADHADSYFLTTGKRSKRVDFLWFGLLEALTG